MAFSKSQIDRLGERLKDDVTTEDDLRMLDEYRRSFGDVHDFVVERIRSHIGLAPSSRRAKTTISIVDKLRRESIRLSQIQDIAGCRLIVADLIEQDATTRTLSEILTSTVIDRRTKPSHGYRAVHVIAHHKGANFEVQVRTGLQHVWAQLSEKMADSHGMAVKYGGGPPGIRHLLERASAATASLESSVRKVSTLASDHPDLAVLLKQLEDVRETYIEEIQAIIREANAS